jgi:hypothetical protein
MKFQGIDLILIFTSTLILNNPAYSQAEQKSQPVKNSLSDSVFFHSLVARYARAIDEADTVLASQVWSPTAEISCINPQGTENGWQEINNIYKILKDKFSSRKLSFSDIKFAYYGDVSWLTFNWTFDFTLKTNNSVVQTKGRETQIWRKINYEWRLVHVHYSEMPVTGRRI